MKFKQWTREETLVALNLYCQLPFGKLYRGNPIIIEVAELIGKTPSALAMKLANLSSLDPKITQSGRKGLVSCSKPDKQIWNDFQNNPESIAYESQLIIEDMSKAKSTLKDLSVLDQDILIETDLNTNIETTRISHIKTRLNQNLFRKIILSNYNNTCCITGVRDPRLLIASHIIPWSSDSTHRLNPRNGLCLNVLHDRAFDRGLITITPSYEIKVSKSFIAQEDSPMIQDYVKNFNDSKIKLPSKFLPAKEFLEFHNETIFIG